MGTGSATSVASPAIPVTTAETFKTEMAAGKPSSLPFAHYLAHAVDEHRKDMAGRGDDGDGWQSQLFYFVRLVKAHPSMLMADARTAFAAVAKAIESWRTAIPAEHRTCDDWDYWLDASIDDAEAEFVGSWDKIRILPGRGVLDSALTHAARSPLQLDRDTLGRRTAAYGRFVSIAGWAQVVVGDANIILPVEKLAQVLNVSTMTVSRFRAWAVEDGLLRPTQAAQRHKATRFRFAVERFPILRDRSETWWQSAAYQLEEIA